MYVLQNEFPKNMRSFPLSIFLHNNFKYLISLFFICEKKKETRLKDDIFFKAMLNKMREKSASQQECLFYLLLASFVHV